MCWSRVSRGRRAGMHAHRGEGEPFVAGRRYLLKRSQRCSYIGGDGTESTLRAMRRYRRRPPPARRVAASPDPPSGGPSGTTGPARPPGLPGCDQAYPGLASCRPARRCVVAARAWRPPSCPGRLRLSAAPGRPCRPAGPGRPARHSTAGLRLRALTRLLSRPVRRRITGSSGSSSSRCAGTCRRRAAGSRSPPAT